MREPTDKTAAPQLERSPATEAVTQLRIPAYVRAELLLIAAGNKPATDFELNEHFASSEEEIAEAAKALGLVVHKQIDTDPEFGPQLKLTIAGDKKTALALVNLEREDDAGYGRLMGFPETAIEAFGDNERMLSSRESGAFTDQHAMGELRLSRDHFQEEIAAIQEKDEIIKRIAPQLYDDILAKNTDTRASINEYDIQNLDDLSAIIQKGDPTLLQYLAEQTGIDRETIDQFAHRAKLHNEITQSMDADIRARLLKEPNLTPTEKQLGQVIEAFEPQTRQAVLRIAAKGYPVLLAKYSPPEGKQRLFTTEPCFTQAVLTEVSRAVEPLGFTVEIAHDQEIELTPPADVTLDQLTNAWNALADALPSRRAGTTSSL